MERSKKNLLLFAVFLVLTVAATLFAFLALPSERSVSSLGVMLGKILPVALAALAIAFFDPGWIFPKRKEFLILIITLGFLVFFCLFIPRLFAYQGGEFTPYYIWTQMLVGYIILFVSLAFRVGGGSTGHTIRLSSALLLLMLSGIEDIAYLTVNRGVDPSLGEIPEVWTWASHIKVRIGHFPTKYEAYAFIAFHVVLAAFVIFFKFPRKTPKQSESD